MVQPPEAASGAPGALSAFARRTRHRLVAGPRLVELGERTLVLGVLNCTPDSFSDGGRHLASEDAARRIEEMADEGVDWIDVGGESTRPGAVPVDAEEEWRRVAPALRAAHSICPDRPVSIDTTKMEVARRAIEEGACIINDVSGLRFEPELADLAARSGAALVVMHMQGEPRTMQVAPAYRDVAEEVAVFLRQAVAEAERRGVARDRILIDPGIGFGKTLAGNLELIRSIPRLAALGYPVLLGASRKSFLGRILDLPVEDRLEGSLAAHVAAVLAGAHVIRAHDVRATVRAVRLADALLP